MTKPSEVFEGPNSSLKRAFDSTVVKEPFTTEEQLVVNIERYRTSEAIKSICDIEVTQLSQMITYIVDQRLTTKEAEKDRIMKVAADYMNEVDYQNFSNDL